MLEVTSTLKVHDVAPVARLPPKVSEVAPAVGVMVAVEELGGAAHVVE